MRGGAPTQESGGRTLRTEGRSMHPLIAPRSFVHYVAVPDAGPSTGAIVVFDEGTRLVAHRMLARRERNGATEIMEKGDHNRMATWVAIDRVKGIAVALTRDGMTRRLDIDPGRRLRALCSLGRCEAAVAGWASRARQRGVPRVLLRACAAPFLVVLWPVRSLAMRLALSAYPPPKPLSTPLAREVLLAATRSVHRATPLPPPALLAPKGAQGNAVIPEDEQAAIVSLSARHRVVIPVFDWLKRLGLDTSLRPDNRKAFTLARHRTTAMHAMTMRGLVELGARLDESGTRYVILKGPSLYVQLYRDAFPRPYDDIDLLVAPADVGLAIGLLSSLGYRAPETPFARWFAGTVHFHIGLANSRPGMPPVELHWSLVDRANLFHINSARVLATARRLHAGPVSFQVPSVPEELLYLCLHAQKHGILNAAGLRKHRPATWFLARHTDNRLSWFLDIERMIRKYRNDIDWAAFVADARATNTAQAVGEVLTVLLRVEPGSEVADIDALQPLLIQRKGPSRDRAAAPPSGLSSRLVASLLRVGSATAFRPIRLLFLAKLLLPSPGALKGFYRCRHSAVVPLLYLLHPAIMLGRILGVGSERPDFTVVKAAPPPCETPDT